MREKETQLGFQSWYQVAFSNYSFKTCFGFLIVDYEEWTWSRVMGIFYKVPFLTWVVWGSFKNKQYCGTTF